MKLKISKKPKDIRKKLEEVYTDSDGKIPDLTKLENNQRPLWKTILYVLIVIMFFILSASAAGFFVFNAYVESDNFTNEKITVKIDTPITLSSGRETVYTVMLTNKEKVNLYNAELKLIYPDNFQYLSSEPVAMGEEKDTWSFSVLKVGETQKIELKGKVLAAVGSTQTFKGVLKFKPANLNAEFKQEVIVDVLVASSVVGLDVIGPDKILSNQEADYEIRYYNKGEDDLQDLQIVIDYPSGFIFKNADVEADKGSDNLWSIAELKSGEEGAINIQGDYSATSGGGNKEINARIQLRQNGDYYPQATQSLITNVVKDQLSLQLIINGSAEDQTINFDDLLVYSLSYKNTGEEPLKDITLTAYLDSQILDWSSFNADVGGSLKNNSVVWTGKDVPQLLQLGAGEEGEINWTIRVKDADIVANESVGKFAVNSYTEAVVEQSGDIKGQSKVKSKTITAAVNSDLSLSTGARYYNEYNIPLGTGPIRPQVGEESSYNVQIKLANNLHDVNSIVVTATLPQNVTWSDKESHTVGDVMYSESTNTVSWTISRLAKSATNTELNFNVGINPGDDDFGRVLILVSQITLTGKDANTGSNIEATKKAITTAFDDPILGQVIGVVE